MIRSPRRWLGLVACSWLAGCATTHRPPGAWAVARSMRPATTPLLASGFHLPDEGVRRFEMTIRDSAPRTIEHTSRPSDRFGSSWVVVEGDLREMYYRHDEEGNVVMTAVIEHADRAISLFRPPLIVGYATLSPDETRTQEVAMRVVDRDRPQRLKERGTVTQTIRFTGEALVEIDGKELWTQQLEVEFYARLRAAIVRRDATILLLPERGVAFERWEKTIWALGLIIRNEQGTRRRLDAAL